jgi:hypothetical protein
VESLIRSLIHFRAAEDPQPSAARGPLRPLPVPAGARHLPAEGGPAEGRQKAKARGEVRRTSSERITGSNPQPRRCATERVAQRMDLRLSSSGRVCPETRLAALRVLVTVNNFTGHVWDRSNVVLGGGIWSENGIPSEHWPKVHLDADGNVVPGEDWFMSESGGFATGTEGWVDYTTQGIAGTLRIHWNNPFAGGNEFTAVGPPQFAYGWGDPGGSDAHIDLHIGLPTAPPKEKKSASPTAFRGTAPSY